MQKTEFQLPAAANDEPTTKRAHRCETCKWVHNNPQAAEAGLLDLQCRRNPPRPHPMLAPSPTGPRLVGAVSVFPPVNAGEWCGEWQPPLAVMQ